MICFLEHELGRLLEQLVVEPVGFARLGGKPVAWREFLRQRTGAGLPKPDMDCGSGFMETVAGPVASGEASHFGMGIEVGAMEKIEEIKEESGDSW